VVCLGATPSDVASGIEREILKILRSSHEERKHKDMLFSDNNSFAMYLFYCCATRDSEADEKREIREKYSYRERLLQLLCLLH
jgi:hypothetical protein